MEAFSKFGGDLDAATKSVLDKGARNVEILKQPQFTPYCCGKAGGDNLPWYQRAYEQRACKKYPGF